MLLTKFGKHPCKHVEEVAIILEERKKKRQDPSKLGVPPNLISTQFGTMDKHMNK